MAGKMPASLDSPTARVSAGALNNSLPFDFAHRHMFIARPTALTALLFWGIAVVTSVVWAQPPKRGGGAVELGELSEKGAGSGIVVPGKGAARILGDFPRERYLKMLKTGPEAQKLAVLGALDQRGQDPQVAELLLQTLKEAPTAKMARASTVRMIMLLGRFKDQPAVVERLMSCRKADHYKIGMVAIDALGEIGDPKMLDGLLELTASPHYGSVYGYRKCVLHAIMKIHDQRAMVSVIKQLSDLKGQLLFDAVHYLSHHTLQPFGTSQAKWKAWYLDNQEDFNFSENDQSYSSTSAASADFRWDSEVPKFFGTSIYAKRMVFVLDVSSSMSQPAGDGTRVDMAKRELIGAIGALPEDAYFNIVPYHGRVTVYKKELVAANERTKAHAIGYVKRLRTNTGTASYDALDRAFKIDGNTEAIFFLSDGDPSAGKITDKGRIVDVITRENFFRRIAVYSFGVGMDGDETEEFMKDLAKNNGGVYVGVH